MKELHRLFTCVKSWKQKHWVQIDPLLPLPLRIAVLDIRWLSQAGSILSLGRTVFIVAGMILAFSGFTATAMTMVINPIDRMLQLVSCFVYYVQQKGGNFVCSLVCGLCSLHLSYLLGTQSSVPFLFAVASLR